MPRARSRGLIVTPRAGELMIFDLEHHFSHRLDRRAAQIWRMSDGGTSPDEMARRLGGASRTEVLVILRQLKKARLVEGTTLAELDRLIGATDGQRAALAFASASFVRTFDCDVRRLARRAARRPGARKAT